MNRLVSTSVNGRWAFDTGYDAAGRVILTAEKEASAPEITCGVPAPVVPVAPVEPSAPPAGASQTDITAYNTKKAQYDNDKLAYDQALEQYKSDLQDYNDQNAYLDGVRAVASTIGLFSNQQQLVVPAPPQLRNRHDRNRRD